MEEEILYSPAEPRTRPTLVSILAVLGYVFGGFTLLLGPIGVLQLLFQNDPLHIAMRNDAIVYYSTIAGSVLGMFMAGIEIWLAYGLWNLKEWARSGTATFCVFLSVWSVIVGALQQIYVMPKIWAITMAAQQPTMPPEAAKMMKTMQGAMLIFGIAVLVVFAGIYIGIAVYLTRPSVKEAFRPEGTE